VMRKLNTHLKTGLPLHKLNYTVNGEPENKGQNVGIGM
jgi:hypothetical protein